MLLDVRVPAEAVTAVTVTAMILKFITFILLFTVSKCFTKELLQIKKAVMGGEGISPKLLNRSVQVK